MPRWPGSSRATAEEEEIDESGAAPRAPRAKVMSAREADRLREDLASLIQDAGDYLDYGLSQANAAGAECGIWAFDEEEADKLADVWLSRAKKSAAAAQTVRYVLSQWAYVQVAVMLGGRFFETVAFVADSGGLAVPAVMRDRARFAAHAPAQPATAQPRAASSASSAQASAQASRPAPTHAPTPPPAPPSDYAAAEEAQRAHAARVSALRDGSGTAAAAVADTMPEGAPGSAPPPDLSAVAEEVGA